MEQVKQILAAEAINRAIKSLNCNPPDADGALVFLNVCQKIINNETDTSTGTTPAEASRADSNA
jgi:hypothetical protein